MQSSPKPLVAARSGKAGSALLLGVVNLALLGGVAYLTLIRSNKSMDSTKVNVDEYAAADAGGKVAALGRLQPKSGVVNIFGPPGDRVDALNFSLGSTVKKGDVLFAFSGELERRLAIDTLKAQKAEANKVREAAGKSKVAKRNEIDAEIRKGEAELGAQLAALNAKVEASKLQQARAAAELSRLETIRRNGVSVAEMDFLQIKTLADQAEIELRALEEQKVLAKVQAEAAKAAALAKVATFEAEADRALALIPYESLNAAEAAAEAKLASATIRAPFDGKIVKVAAKPGDTVATFPLLQVADTSAMVVVAEVYESDVPRLRKALADAKASIAVEVNARNITGDGKALKGTVTQADIAPIIAKNTVFALDPRGDSDRRVIEVEVKLDAAGSKAAADFIGLQVRVEFAIPGAGKP